MSKVWEDAPYSEGSLLVLLALADWANDDGLCWPSISRLAKKARLEDRQTQAILRRLEADGVVEVERGGGRGHQNRYLIRVQNLHPLIIEERVHLTTQRVHFGAEKVQSSAPDPLVLDPLVEPPPNARAGRDYNQTAAGIRSAQINRRPRNQPKTRVPRKPPAPSPQEWELPPDFQPDLATVVATLRDEMGLMVPRGEIEYAAAEWKRSREGQMLRSEPQKNLESFVRKFAYNHWRERYSPKADVFGSKKGWVPENYYFMEPEERRQFDKDQKLADDDDLTMCGRCGRFGNIRFDGICPKCLTSDEVERIGKAEVDNAAAFNRAEATKRQRARVA